MGQQRVSMGAADPATLARAAQKRRAVLKGGGGGAVALFRYLVYAMGAWSLLVTLLLNLFANHYLFVAIDGVRDSYVTNGASGRIKADAAAAFTSVLGARDAVHYAIRTKLYFEPQDYDVVQSILAPIFASKPLIYTVDLGFSDRPASIQMRRLGSGSVLIQSDADDCFLISGMGCSVKNTSAHETGWFQAGLRFARQEYRTFASSGESIFQWSGPEFIAKPGKSVEGSTNTVVWGPSYSLVFYTIFPGTMDKLYAIGKVTMDLSEMGDSVLQDEALGLHGRVYICNRQGAIVSSREPAEQVVVARPSGQLLFRRIWELPDPWAQQLDAEVLVSTEEQNFELQDGTLVHVSPFAANDEALKALGMDDFVVIVVTTRASFTDSILSVYCAVSFVVAYMPYVNIALIVFVFLARRRQTFSTLSRRMNAVEEAKAALQEVRKALKEVGQKPKE